MLYKCIQIVFSQHEEEEVSKLKILEHVLFGGVPCVVVACVVGALIHSAVYAAPVIPLFFWWSNGFFIVGTKERCVKTFLGKPYTACESGLRWKPYLLSQIIRFPTDIIELEFRDKSGNVSTAGIITKEGPLTDEKGDPINSETVYKSVTLGAVISVLFQYPEGDDLIKCAIRLPHASTLEETKTRLADLFEEPVFDQVRTVGGDMVYPVLMRRRAHFAKQVLASILSDRDGVLGTLLRESGLARLDQAGQALESTKVQIAIKHLDIPEDLKKALSADEIATLQGKAEVTAAKKTREATVEKGKGVADAKKAMLDVIREHPENLPAQALLTLIEMAQGPATTVFPLSTDLTNVLGKVLGRQNGDAEVGNLLRALTGEQRTALLDLLRTRLGSGGNQ